MKNPIATLIGRTIRASHFYCGHLVLVFEDGEYAHFKPEREQWEDGYFITQVTDEFDACMLRSIGLISEEEAQAHRDEADKQRRSEEEKREREQLERLKAKYEKPNLG